MILVGFRILKISAFCRVCNLELLGLIFIVDRLFS